MADAAGVVGFLNVSPSAQVVGERDARERVDGGDDVIGDVPSQPRCACDVPAVHEPVEGDESGERLAGHLADGRGDRALHRVLGVHGVEQIVHGPAELRGRDEPVVHRGRGGRGFFASE